MARAPKNESATNTPPHAPRPVPATVLPPEHPDASGGEGGGEGQPGGPPLEQSQAGSPDAGQQAPEAPPAIEPPAPEPTAPAPQAPGQEAALPNVAPVAAADAAPAALPNARPPAGVQFLDLSVPYSQSTRYAPTSLMLSLTPKQARVLACISEGSALMGVPLRHPADALKKILDYLGRDAE